MALGLRRSGFGSPLRYRVTLKVVFRMGQRTKEDRPWRDPQ
jgi:hypothetical protein